MHARLLLTFALVLLGSCVTTPPPALPPEPVTEAPALPLEACRLADVPEPVLCGTLQVPENRALAAQPGRMIGLRIVVIPALGDRTLPPLFDLAGGPGLAATESAAFWATLGVMHRENRDIVLVDQRGTGGSNALPCAVGFSNPL
ncbi:MAG TPA: alpha/beta hydrolase, partial [Verrucomicrobiae bacterium]|nr:alpha/beta hydrolase [Verrucomicrobiae bacterium]